MKKLGDAIGSWDDAGHMGRGENSEAVEGSSPCTPSSKSREYININSRERGGTLVPPYNPPLAQQKCATPDDQNLEAPVTPDNALRASLSLGIPDWFVAYWYEQLSARDWRMTNGRKLTKFTWKANLLSWWSHKTPLERAQIETDYNNAKKDSAADFDDPEPQIEVTAHHWYECQRTCAYFKKGKCIWGARHPAVLYKRNDGFTDRCYHFKPLPLEWQNAWMLDPKFWEPYWTRNQFGQEYLHPGWKTTKKGQRVKAYFDAHPDELEEARWRNDANEPTEAECAAVRAWLAWLARTKARGKRKEADMK